MLRPLLAALLLLAAPALAQITDAERRATTAPLLDRLAAATDPAAARDIENAIWIAWSTGPTQAATDAVAEARRRLRVFDLDGAVAAVQPVIDAHPDYAEAINQRAFARFLREDYDGSLEDIDRVLEIEPRHFGALGGKALVLMRQGRVELGQTALRAALAINPFMPERAMLIPVPEGEDI